MASARTRFPDLRFPKKKKPDETSDFCRPDEDFFLSSAEHGRGFCCPELRSTVAESANGFLYHICDMLE